MKANITKRKINIQIDRFDTWSLDHTLALIILPAIIQLKETKQGVPGDFAEVGGEDYIEQCSFDFYTETHAWAFNEKVKQWDEVLDKIIWSFQQIINSEYDKIYHHGHIDFDFVKSDTLYKNPITKKLEETYQMVDKNPEGHWYDIIGHQLHEERIQEGLTLFGKYFRALWD